MRFNLMMLAALFFGLGILTACQTADEPVKTEQATATNTTSAPKTDEHGHKDDAPRITLEEAKKDFDAGNAVFVDTRAESSYKMDHIKGAFNLPIESFEAKYKDLPKDKKLIVYCS